MKLATLVLLLAVFIIPVAADDVDRWIQDLRDPVPAVREAAASALAELTFFGINDTRAVEPLIRALNDENVDVRKSAVIALSRFNDTIVIEPLIQALDDENSSVRRHAALAFDTSLAPAVLLTPRAVEPLTKALNDEDSWVRIYAAQSLYGRNDARAVGPLIQALDDEDDDVRIQAAQSLGQINDTRAVGPLILALADEDPDVRIVAASALGKLGDTRAVEPLKSAINDENEDVQEAAIQAYDEIIRLDWSKGDKKEALAWLKETCNITSFDAPEKNTEYSIMSWWGYSNLIMYMAKRPAVANNLQAGWENVAKFYLSESEEKATALLDSREPRYIFVDHGMAYGKLEDIANWANEDPSTYFTEQKYSASQITIIPTERLFNTTLGKLYFFDGAGTGHFRLIYESRTFLGENPAKAQVKIFEYVPGALIRVRTAPDQKVGCVLNMTSNQDRPFIYANQAAPKDGVLEMKVPYSTESRYGCHAIHPYLVFSGTEFGVKMQNLTISEEDVLTGKTIELTF